MIRLVYSKARLWNVYQGIWCILSFLVVNLIFFYVLLKACFFEFVSNPPLALTIILLIILFADTIVTPIMTKKIFGAWWIVDLIIWVMVTVSFALPDQIIATYFGLASIIRIYDVVYLKEMLFDMVKSNYWVYKIYIILKIVYWIIVFGHVAGCLFYALEMYLLNNQKFGSFELYYTNYYQGQLLAYTPIYMFKDLNTYVYAIYFTFALISTIAFGDIIGKNWVEDIYVMILIILATIGISFIVEQMYIIFRRKKNLYLKLLYFKMYIEMMFVFYPKGQNSMNKFRDNFANWRSMNQQPIDLQIFPEWKIKLIRQSLFANGGLPIFFQKFVLHKLTMTHYPPGIQISSNFPHRQHLTSFLVIKGSYWVGYSLEKGKLVGGYQTQIEGINFGIQQALAGTNSLYPWLCIRTVKSSHVLTLSHHDMHDILHELQNIEFPYDWPIEHYQIAKDKAIQCRQKYVCSICRTADHTLVDCPQCHYVVDNVLMISLVKRENQRQKKRRGQIKSVKIRNIYLQMQIEKKEQDQRLKQILRLQEMLNELRLQNNKREIEIQKWHKWAIYGPQQPFIEQDFVKITI